MQQLWKITTLYIAIIHVCYTMASTELISCLTFHQSISLASWHFVAWRLRHRFHNNDMWSLGLCWMWLSIMMFNPLRPVLKTPIFWRWRFQMPFHERVILCFDPHPNEVCFWDPIQNDAALIKVMACCFTDDKPFPEPLMDQHTHLRLQDKISV